MDRFYGIEDCSERICAGCNVNEPWEHRCCGGDCECADCRDSDEFMDKLRNATPEQKEKMIADILGK